MLSKKINEKLWNKNFNEFMDFPTNNLLIDVTNFCNNQCIFCYNNSMLKKRKFIDFDLCIRVLKEAYELGCREVGFYGTGEPLIDKRLELFIKKAKEIGFSYIYITTNGILANLELIKRLYNAGLNSIKFSINAINAKDYIFIHNTDNFDVVIKNLTDIYKWKNLNLIPLNVYVSYIATDFTYNPVEINKFFKNKCDELVVMPAVNQGGLIPGINEFLSSNITSNINNNFTLPCNYPFNSIFVTVDGYLSACCMDFENLLVYADLNKTSLKDAWNCKTIRKFRKMHLEKNVENTICENCIFNVKRMPKPLDDKIFVGKCKFKNIEEEIKERRR